MKKTFRSAAAACLTAAALFAACPLTSLAEANPWRVGDCNYDGSVNIADVVCLNRWINSGNASKVYNPRMDVNGDGTVDCYDSTTLIMILTGR